MTKSKTPDHIHDENCDHEHGHEHDPGHVHGPDCQHETTFRHQGPKLGRNDPCYCGSGKKYKKCHG